MYVSGANFGSGESNNDQKLKSLGDRQDFTYNIVSFVLWVKYVLTRLQPVFS